MVIFDHHATSLPELTERVPPSTCDMEIKNYLSRLHQPAAVVRAHSIEEIQSCVQWALKHQIGLSVVSGSHSGHCFWPNVVAVDLSAFDRLQIWADFGGQFDASLGRLIIAGAGCKTGDIVREAMESGVTVPLGSWPSVGTGLWLQGGIGHLARAHGLACDFIVGAVIVSVNSGEVLLVGTVPYECRPPNAVRPDNEAELLWAIKEAGTNYGIVVSVVFKTCTAPTFSVRSWVVPLNNDDGARLKLVEFGQLATKLPTATCSADAYVYFDAGQLRLGVTLFDIDEDNRHARSTPRAPSALFQVHYGKEDKVEIMDSHQVFDAEMYVSRMHGGHGGDRTSAFKRCVFLGDKDNAGLMTQLVSVMKNRPSPLCYFHLIQGGGAISEVGVETTASGCRDWTFACVITGVWPREEDGGEGARSAVDWVYDATEHLLPFSNGVYGADLGPDSQDSKLAHHTFGLHSERLVRLKNLMDPHNILRYTCPLPQTSLRPELIVLVTGERGAGKDYCASLWQSKLTESSQRSLTVRVASISDDTKREYARQTSASLVHLLEDRGYKAQHRSVLTQFFKDQVKQRPRLPEENFLNVVYTHRVRTYCSSPA
jgi:hypothetical protein